MSDRDIASGARWGDAIAENLKLANVGIICITTENVAKPWLHFEAGAISKTVKDAYVCPLLFDLEPSAIEGPLAQYQAARFDHDGVLRILQTIRSHPEHSKTLSDIEFVDFFEIWWPKLEEKVQRAIAELPKAPPQRSEREMLSETLELVRTMLRQARGPRTAFEEKVTNLAYDDSAYGRTVTSALSSKAKAMQPAVVANMLREWDSTLAKLLHGDDNVFAVVQALLSGRIGEATTMAMKFSGYPLPEARQFIDSISLAISRLVERAE